MKMKSKTNQIIRLAPAVVIGLAICMSAAMKITGNPEVVSVFAKTGLVWVIRYFGIAELVFVCLFWWRPTMRVGFLLLCCYYGGATAVELATGGFFALPAAILAVIWVSVYLRDPFIFGAADEDNGRQTAFEGVA